MFLARSTQLCAYISEDLDGWHTFREKLSADQ